MATSPRGKLSRLLQAPAIFLLETLGEHLWGFKPALMSAFVQQRGALRSVVWFLRHQPKYERILEEWGPLRTHFLVATISALNGCPYCTYGHAYALGLHYLRQHDERFPLSEAQFVALYHLRPEESQLQLTEALHSARLSGEVFYLQRVLELRQTRSLATTATDADLLHLITMFAALNRCGIACALQPDQAHDPINRNRALRDRYAALSKTAALTAPRASGPPVTFGRTVLSPEDLVS